MNSHAMNRLSLALVAAGLLFGASAHAETLRLSTLAKPDSDGGIAAAKFAEEVGKRTNGELEVKVYPASQLGDWTEVHEQVMQGAVDMAMQPLSTSFDSRLAITWFPYTMTTYESAEAAMTSGGYIHQIVDDIIAGQNLTLLGVFGEGMGGAGFTKAIDDPVNPDVKRNIKIRVWPGGTTHQALMERLGYNTATVPWAELYTGMQTGVVDGQIGGTPEMALENFKDITDTWIQYNDHFEAAWFFINRERYESLSEEHQKVLLDVAQEITRDRFEQVREADAKFLQVLRDAGVNVVTFDDATLEKLAAVARADVWPDIQGEIGEETMAKLRSALGLN